MRLQIAIIAMGLCGAVLAAPANNPRNEPRRFPWPFPGEGNGPEPEPSLPFPHLPFPTESLEPTKNPGISRFLPIHGPGVGGRCGESPLDRLPELEENLPWEALSENEDASGDENIMRSNNVMEDESVIEGEEAEKLS